jgi:hypothetical protein
METISRVKIKVFFKIRELKGSGMSDEEIE